MSEQSKYLQDCIRGARANLAKPNIRYPNGRMSHDVEREHLAQCEFELADLAIDCGLFDAHGRLVDYA